MAALNRKVTVKKVYCLVSDTVKLPPPEMLSSEHDIEAVHSFINTCETYFKLAGVSDTNKQALFTKTRLNKTARTWYDS